MKGSVHDLIEILSWDLPGGTVKTTETLSQDNQCTGRDLNVAYPECKSEKSPIELNAAAIKMPQHVSSLPMDRLSNLECPQDKMRADFGGSTI
jgi:hypothetical protein